VEYQELTTFPRPQPFWWQDRPVKPETLGEGKSQRALPKPPEVQSQTPTSSPKITQAKLSQRGGCRP
jgi:hypothetical protein